MDKCLKSIPTHALNSTWLLDFFGCFSPVDKNPKVKIQDKTPTKLIKKREKVFVYEDLDDLENMKISV